MNIEGYVGICGVCFEPIMKGEETTIREEGLNFHLKCVKDSPDSYYVALERITSQFEQGANPTELMNEMERVFKIPVLNDPDFNEDHPKVIQLYRKISYSRDL